MSFNYPILNLCILCTSVDCLVLTCRTSFYLVFI